MEEKLVSEMNEFLSASSGTDDGDLPFEPLDAFSTEPVEFSEMAGDMLDKVENLFDLTRLYNRHSVKYLKAFALLEKGIRIKRTLPCDITPVQKFIEENFSRGWADEALPAIMKGSCFIAVREKEILAFGCVDATARAFIGPCGTREDARGLGLYRALSQRCYRYLIEHGYQYAIVGMAAYTVRGIHRDLGDATVIEGSRGSYDNLLVRTEYY